MMEFNNISYFRDMKLTKEYADEFEYLLKILKEKDTFTVITHLKNIIEYYDVKDEDNIKW